MGLLGRAALLGRLRTRAPATVCGCKFVCAPDLSMLHLAAVSGSQFCCFKCAEARREVLWEMALMLTLNPDEPDFKFLSRPLKLKVSVACL